MRQLLTGLHYCHVNQVLHRDIKGSNLLIDNEGILKLADFGLARSFSNDHNGNLTNRVITLWYRPPELLLGATKYGPAVDMWSVGCIFAELLHGKPILPRKNECYNNSKPSSPMKRRVRENFRHFDRHLSLPKYESSHEFQTKKKRRRQQQRQNEELAKRQKLQHTGKAHLIPLAIPNLQCLVDLAITTMGKPCGPAGGPNRYPPSGNPSGGYNPDRGGQLKVIVVPRIRIPIRGVVLHMLEVACLLLVLHLRL